MAGGDASVVVAREDALGQSVHVQMYPVYVLGKLYTQKMLMWQHKPDQTQDKTSEGVISNGLQNLRLKVEPNHSLRL
jgi:hypothetical protein